MIPILEEIVGEKINLREMTMEEFDTKGNDANWPYAWPRELSYKVWMVALFESGCMLMIDP